MRIKNVEFQNRAFLAPMAGVADRAFREICVQWGAAYTVSEMVSAKALTMHDKKSMQLMEMSPAERPRAIQLFGNEPQVMAEAAAACMAFSPDIIDINMGCPAPKIAQNGSGSALMKDPVLAGQIVSAVSRAVPVPVTVKIRKGWDDTCLTALDVALAAQENGAAAVTLHGRTRKEMYSGRADWEIIRTVKQALSIPVIGNGDVRDEQSAAQMLEQTGCDAVMIGRGAIADPALLRKLHGGTPATRQEIQDFTRTLYQSYQDFYGQVGPAAQRMKEVWFFLIHLFEGGERHHKKMRRLHTPAEYEAVEASIFQELPLRDHAEGAFG